MFHIMARVSQIVETCNPGLKNIKTWKRYKKKHQPDDLKHSIQYTLFMNQKDFLSTQNTIFTAFIATVEKT